MHYTSRSSSQGFSLLELTIVLVVMSLIIGGALAIATGQYTEFKERVTKRKIEEIVQAFKVYVNTNHRLPCPANPELDFRHPMFGKEMAETEMDKTLPVWQPKMLCLSDPYTHIRTTGDIFMGALPVKTLNLPAHYIYDGWDHRFTYVVDQRGAGLFSFVNPVSGRIIIGTPNGDRTNATMHRYDPAKNTGASAVLISHGENGHGSYPSQGGSTLEAIGSDHPGELANCQCDATATPTTMDNYFVQGDKTKLTSSGTSSKPFDDFVWVVGAMLK